VKIKYPTVTQLSPKYQVPPHARPQHTGNLQTWRGQALPLYNSRTFVRNVRATTPPGFSIIEVVIAIGIVAILLTGVLAVMTPAQRSISNNLDKRNVKLIKDTLQRELTILRVNQTMDYDSVFEKNVAWMLDSDFAGRTTGKGNKNQLILIYSYRGDLSTTPHADGTLMPYTKSSGTHGKDFIIQTVCRNAGDTNSLYSTEIHSNTIEGNIYAVRMRQMIINPQGQLELTERIDSKFKDQLVESNKNGGYTIRTDDLDNYTAAALTVQVDFYILPSNNKELIEHGDWSWDTLKKPALTFHMGLSR